MGLFKIFRKKDEKETNISNAHSIKKKQIRDRHKVRINNLNEELEKLYSELDFVENNMELPRGEVKKTSDRIIKRMTLIKYEVDIREGLL